jgi:hypothetical protein
MAKIENFNCEGLCQNQFCDCKYTHSILLKVKDIEFFVLLCEEHYNELQNKILGVLNGNATS